MTNSFLKTLDLDTLNSTEQTKQAHPSQKKNAAGGYTFTVSDVERLRRWFILGSERGTYYASAQELTKDNAKFLLEFLDKEHRVVVDTIVDVSLKGSAPKQDTVLFALAVAVSTGSDDERKYALSKVSEVARTGSHLFTFVGFVQNFRGWGRGLCKAVGSWYTSKDVDALAYQVLKYRQRNGFTHRDVLRLSHPSPVDYAHKELFAWITQDKCSPALPELVDVFKFVQAESATLQLVLGAIESYPISWEMLPDRFLTEPSVWEALIKNNRVPLTALIRQLPRLTRLDVLKPRSETRKKVVSNLTNQEYIRKSRVHPMTVLSAAHTYDSGESRRGNSAWIPDPSITKALNKTFRLAFENVVPANKKTLIALDVSGSMSWETTSSGLTPMEIGAAIAGILDATEPETHIVGFSSRRTNDTGMTPLRISGNATVQENVDAVSNIPFGGTDCSLPMKYATKEKLDVDTFIIITDNETYAGRPHPHQALNTYRRRFNKDAKLIVLGVTATQSTVTDPDDPGSLSLVGYDPAIPKLINDFSRGL